MKHVLCAFAFLPAFAPTTFAQVVFGPEQVLSSTAETGWDVYATDLDGDGDVDVLSASGFFGAHKIAWYENLGAGTFGPENVLTTAVNVPTGVFAADLDGDGDADVLSASRLDNKVAWYENLGAGTFGPQKILSTTAIGAWAVYAADLDGDGDLDVLAANEDSLNTTQDSITWYENLGAGTFGPQQVITTAVNDATDVHAADLDGDGDADVLSASWFDNKIAWYENLGAGLFGPQQIITTAATRATGVHAVDLDGDGDEDVLSASNWDDKIAWYENLGGVIGPQQVISTAASGPRDVFAADIDGDGDADVLSASAHDDKIAWYENLGGSFGPQQVIFTTADGAFGVFAADLDGDGDVDALSSSYFDDEIAWYENLGTGVISYCVQTKPTSVTSCTATLGVSNLSLDFGVWATSDIPRDTSLGTGTVVGTYLYTNGVGGGPSTFTASVPFGTLCLSGLARSGPVVLPGAVGGACNAGPMTFFVSTLTSPPLAVGEDVNVQLWYRDPLPANSGNANFSNAVFYTVQ